MRVFHLRKWRVAVPKRKILML